MYFFIQGGGGGGARGLPKNYFDEGWGGGGVMQFSNYTPPKPTSPPNPIKNERSLKLRLAFFAINEIQ